MPLRHSEPGPARRLNPMPPCQGKTRWSPKWTERFSHREVPELTEPLSVASPSNSGLPPHHPIRAATILTQREPPKAAFVTRLRSCRLPDEPARQLPGPTDRILGGSRLHSFTGEPCPWPLGHTENSGKPASILVTVRTTLAGLTDIDRNSPIPTAKSCVAGAATNSTFKPGCLSSAERASARPCGVPSRNRKPVISTSISCVSLSAWVADIES